MREMGLKEESQGLVVPCDKAIGGWEEEEEYLDEKGGTRYRGLTARLNYLGQDDLEALSNEFIFTSYDSDTAEEERNGLVRYIKLGFIPFLSHKDALQSFDIL